MLALCVGIVGVCLLLALAAFFLRRRRHGVDLQAMNPGFNQHADDAPPLERLGAKTRQQRMQMRLGGQPNVASPAETPAIAEHAMRGATRPSNMRLEELPSYFEEEAEA